MQQSPQDALHAQPDAHRCTALQVIQLSGYTEHEKQHIARLYLEKEVRKNCAIPEGSVELTDKALDVLIKQYCRESGVRSLKKHLEKVFRKVALKLATSDQVTVRSKCWVLCLHAAWPTCEASSACTCCKGLVLCCCVEICCKTLHQTLACMPLYYCIVDCSSLRSLLKVTKNRMAMRQSCQTGRQAPQRLSRRPRRRCRRTGAAFSQWQPQHRARSLARGRQHTQQQQCCHQTAVYPTRPRLEARLRATRMHQHLKTPRFGTAIHRIHRALKSSHRL